MRRFSTHFSSQKDEIRDKSAVLEILAVFETRYQVDFGEIL